MADMKKYLDTTALGTLVDQIKAEDAKALAAAKLYADGLATNYDEAGAAATAEANAKAYTDALADGQVKTNKEAIATLNGDANTTGSVAKAIADAKAVIDGDIDAVEAIANKNKEDIAAINNASTGILAQAKGYADTEVAKVQGEVDNLETYVGTFTHDTAKSVVEYINAKTDGIATSGNLEALGSRVTAVEGDVATIKGDYLKAADKTEIEGKITAVQTAVDTEKSRAEGIESGLRTDVDAIKGDYLKAEDKTELSNAIAAEAERAAGVESGLETRLKAVEDDYLTSSDKDALQNQINTIMNNPDAEGAINSINEFTQYVKDHGTIADGFRTDIDKNKEDIAANAKAIADQATADAATYATKTELANEKKALQDEIDADVKVVADDLAELDGVVAGLAESKADATALAEAVEALEGVDAGFETRIAAIEDKFGEGDSTVESLIATAKQEAIDAAASAADTKDEAVLAAAKKYADDEDALIEARVADLETASATHATKGEVEAVAGDVATLKTDMAQAKTDIDAVEELAAANKTAHEANAAAIALKAAQSDLEAALVRVAKNESDIAGLNTTVAEKATIVALNAAIDRIAANEGNITTLTSAVNSFTAITADEVNALFA